MICPPFLASFLYPPSQVPATLASFLFLQDAEFPSTPGLSQGQAANSSPPSWSRLLPSPLQAGDHPVFPPEKPSFRLSPYLCSASTLGQPWTVLCSALSPTSRPSVNGACWESDGGDWRRAVQLITRRRDDRGGRTSSIRASWGPGRPGPGSGHQLGYGGPPLRDARPNPRDLGDSCPMRVPGTAWDFPGGCAIKGTFAAGARAPGHFLPSLTPRGQAPALWPRSFLLRQGGFHPA